MLNCLHSLKGIFSGAGHSFLSPASLLFFLVISQSSDTFLEGKLCDTLGAGVIFTDISRYSFPLCDWQSRNNGAGWCAIMHNQYIFNK